MSTRTLSQAPGPAVPVGALRAVPPSQSALQSAQ